MTVQNITVDESWLEILQEKSAKAVTFADDPIALGCASYRLGQAGTGQYHDLDGLTVLPEDRQLALNIRNYYRSKITWELLKKTELQKPLTPFRQKLMGIIENTYQVTTNDIGILYRVPYFYVEDCEHDAIFTDLPDIDQAGARAVNVESTFTLIRKVKILRRAQDITEYWFKFSQDPIPCMTAIDNKNTLKPLFESIVNRGPVQLRANWTPKIFWGGQEQHRNRWYYKLTQVELA